MKKTLIIKYLPRNEKSNTNKLLEEFLKHHKGFIEILDLLSDVPDYLTSESVNAYIKRNYMGQNLDQNEKIILSSFDKYTKQFIDSDTVVVVTPMYNFSVPAMIKAYFDSIIQKGKTWDIDEKGYVGLMKGKRALILLSSGGVYEGEMKNADHATTLLKLFFEFMGFEDIRVVSLSGLSMFPEKVKEITDRSLEKVREVTKVWYGN